MVLLGLDLRYLMAGCLAATLIYNIFTLKFPPVLTLFPLGAGLVYHFIHGSLKQAAIAFFLPFALYLIKLLRRHIAIYDVLDFSMIGIIMGWPFCLVDILISKVFMAIINNTWMVKLLGRRRHGYEYDFPYVFVMVAGAAATFYLFKGLSWMERALLAIIVLVSRLRAALKAAYLAGESPAPGIAYLPG
jgi:hypothetical protein